MRFARLGSPPSFERAPEVWPGPHEAITASLRIRGAANSYSESTAWGYSKRANSTMEETAPAAHSSSDHARIVVGLRLWSWADSRVRRSSASGFGNS